MRVTVHNEISSESRVIPVPRGTNPATIGSAADATICLRGRLPRQIAEVRRDSGGWKISPRANGCIVDQRPLARGESLDIENEIVVEIAHYTVTIHVNDRHSVSQTDSSALDVRFLNVLQKMQDDLLNDRAQQLDMGDSESATDEQLHNFEQYIDSLLPSVRDFPKDNLTRTDLGDHIAGLHIRNTLIVGLREGGDSLRTEGRSWARYLTTSPELERQLEKVRRQWHDELGLDRPHDLSGKIATLNQNFWPFWSSTVNQLPAHFSRYLAVREVKREMKNLCYGWGPLEDLLQDPTVTEVMVNNARQIFIERDSELENSGCRFASGDDAVRGVIKRIGERVNRSVDASTPMLDARLKDGSRVNAVIDPLVTTGPSLTIRRFPDDTVDMSKLLSWGALSRPAADFLQAAVKHRSNIVISGGTGTGKTTMLNALSGFIPDKERIVTIEDTAELRLQKTHRVGLEARPPNIQGEGEVSIRMLVRNALRMRPDRIVVGECRGGEAIDMLQAMNTGHDGSMTTIHANSPQDVVRRLEVLIQQFSGTNLPVSSIHQQIASGVDIVVQLERHQFRDPQDTSILRKRKFVSAISEIIDVDAEQNAIVFRHIFVRPNGGELMPTGSLPTFMPELCEAGFLELDTLLNANGVAP